MSNIQTFSNVEITVLNNHSGTEQYEKLVILSESTCSGSGVAYAKVGTDEWFKCVANICPIDNSISAYFDVNQDELITDIEVGFEMLR